METEPPPSDSTRSESEFSHISAGVDSNRSSHQGSSDFSVVSNVLGSRADRTGGESYLQALASMYTRHSTATNLHMPVLPPASQQTGTGRGTLIIPGWIRERAAEVLFEGGDVDESSVAEVILDALLKVRQLHPITRIPSNHRDLVQVPVDLRRTLACSILVIGGTAMLPGFIPRLHSELIHALVPPVPSTRHFIKPDKPPPPTYDRYALLRPLVPFLSILNNPSPPPPKSDRAGANAGKAPAFSPATMAWVGGSLAGYVDGHLIISFGQAIEFFSFSDR
jgi:actin-related protein 10